ncbi:succinylglutamate desuccinylase, partial [Burkholderia pseudomallei]
MTSSADSGRDAAWLDDFLALTLAGDAPPAEAGECAA